MLDFFRRHQRYFFAVITVVIVISFSFFGTYSTLSNSSFREQIAFTNVAGTDVTRHELDEMVLFLGTDAQDKLLFGGAWGPNFLNDGVIKKDFLETGLGAQLALAYASDVQPDLAARLEKEKRYTLYVNPQARFVGVESAWNNYAPEMTSYYHVLRVAQDPMSQDALQARIALFLKEKQFPPSLLRQILRFQEKQQSWLKPDPKLDYTDLSIFGYHTAEDWFGPRFVRLVGEFIMNAATIAEQKGYQVSKEDALADLMRNSELSYQQNVRNPNIGVTSSHEYFNEQLRRLGLDKNTAAKTWRQVMLFRRAFQDMGSSVFVDAHTFSKFDAYADAAVEGEIFRLSKEFRLGSYRALQKLEAYLDAVSQRTDDDRAKLTLPTTFLAAAEVAKKHPELVEKRYLLEIAQADKKALQGNIGIKESWNWEVSDAGWEQLKNEFPEIGVAKAATRDERFGVLDNLDDKTRLSVDNFARAAIVDEHAEWLDKALQEATSKREVVGLHAKGGNRAIAGLENGADLIQLLDKAPLASEDAAALAPAAKEASDKLSRYSADKKTYYRISVIDRSPQAEVLTFADADKQGALDKLLDGKLEAYYLKIRDGSPKDFQRDDKSWKSLAEVRDVVADRYFEKVLKGIRSAYTSAVPADKAPQTMIGDYAATLRFFPYVRNAKEKLQKNPEQMAVLTKEPAAVEVEKEALVARPKLTEQWKLERQPYKVVRSSAEQLLDKTELFALADGSWTTVNTPANGDVNFFHLANKVSTENKAQSNGMAQTSAAKVKELLSEDAQQQLMAHYLQQIKAKKAISLNYLNVVAEMEPAEMGYGDN